MRKEKCPLDYITFCKEDSFSKMISAEKCETTVKNFGVLLQFSGFHQFLSKCDCNDILIIISYDSYIIITLKVT